MGPLSCIKRWARLTTESGCCRGRGWAVLIQRPRVNRTPNNKLSEHRSGLACLRAASRSFLPAALASAKAGWDCSGSCLRLAGLSNLAEACCSPSTGTLLRPCLKSIPVLSGSTYLALTFTRSLGTVTTASKSRPRDIRVPSFSLVWTMGS